MEYVCRAILYFDGASRNNPHGPAGCGYRIVEMDDCGADGATVVEGYKYLGYNTSNNEAEYLGLIEGLEMMLSELNVDYLYIRGDSEIVINQLEGEYAVRSWRIMPHYSRVQELLGSLNIYEYRIKWIPREKNWGADQLANEAIDNRDSDYNWWP